MNLDPFMRNLESLLHDLPPWRREDVLAVTRQLRRYATLMEQAAAVSQAVFEGAPLQKVTRLILEGAGRIGHYRDGALVVMTDGRPTVAAAYGEFVGTEGHGAPVELVASRVSRLGPERVALLNFGLGIELPAHDLYLVPVASPDTWVGTLALLDSDGETPDDRLMESYASRAAMAYLHAARFS
jgi:hypothetical protein